MRVSFVNIGCKVNFADASQIREELIQNGAEIVEFGQECDLVLVNTCSVTKKAEADSRKYIRRAMKNSPNAYIGVMGCYAQVNPGEISMIDGVDGIFGTEKKFDIPALVNHLSKKEKSEIFVLPSENSDFHGSCTLDNESRTRIILKIQDGCDYRCSYCIVPLARGGSRSMKTEELLSVLKKIKDSENHEIVLSGINLGTYKSSEGHSLSEILRMMDDLGNKQRLRLSSIEPDLLNDDIIDTVANSKILCRHFHIPLQSGSAEILKLMRRRYSPGYFTDLVTKIKKRIPGCCIGVDVITGFPGESENHFDETYQLLESLPVSYLHVFTYSERENTLAITFEGKVPDYVRKERTMALRELSKKKKELFYLSQIGNELSVIPENYNEKTNMSSGWTDNYIRVEYPGMYGPGIEPVKVKLLELKGEVVRGSMV